MDTKSQIISYEGGPKYEIIYLGDYELTEFDSNKGKLCLKLFFGNFKINEWIYINTDYCQK